MTKIPGSDSKKMVGLFTWTLFIGTLLVALVMASCSSNLVYKAPRDSFVHAHSTGQISASSAIRIEFVNDIRGLVDTPDFLANAIKLNPSVSGVSKWTSANVLEFVPDRPLERKARYDVIFEAGLLRAAFPDAQDFGFVVHTAAQGIDLDLSQAQTVFGSPDFMRIDGTITLNEPEDGKTIESALQAWYRSSPSSIVWQHQKDNRVHHFVLEKLARGTSDEVVNFKLDGPRLGAASFLEKSIVVSGTQSFSLVSSQLSDDGGRHLLLYFSEPVDESQNFGGMVELKDQAGKVLPVRVAAKGSVVKVYKDGDWPAQGQVFVAKGFKSADKTRVLVQTQARPVAAPSEKPAVRFVGKGVIIPSSQGLTVPIETLNLRYLMVEAIRVYHENIPQFLQVNNLAGTSDLVRVGKSVWRQVIDLGYKTSDQDKWVRRGLDMTQLLKNHPDGLFNLKISFRKPHTSWLSASGDVNEVKWSDLQIPGENEKENSYWDYYEDQDEYAGYEERNNPNSDSYYRAWWDHKIDVERNIMISDIGLIARRGTDNKVKVTAVDLKSASPMGGVDIQLLDYTRQVLGTGVSDASGVADFELGDGKAYFVVAKRGNQHAYLKVAEGDVLASSHFDIAGDKAEQGFKGFLYGERGVWRPGDDIFLTFLLHDPQGRLPASHPIVLDLLTPQNQLYRSKTLNSSVDGFYYFPMITDEDAPTGNWMARVRVGGRVFEKALKIETVMPNRLKIDFKLNNNATFISGGKLSAGLEALWLHGAKAPGLRAEIKVALNQSVTGFTGFENYTFDDASRIYSDEPRVIFTGNLDNNGKVAVNSQIETQGYAPGKLRANFDTRVYEPSGSFSVDSFSLDYHPYPRYVGINVPAGDKLRGMLLTDIDHSVIVALVDNAGKPIGSGKLRAELYQINWRWWWEKSADSNLADFVASGSNSRVAQGDIDIRNGRGEWKFKVAYPNWGRYLVRVSDPDGGHATSVIKYIDWPGWAGRQKDSGASGASMLLLSSDKSSYQTGETATISIPGNKDGRALVAIEKAGRLIKQEWITASGETSQYKLPITAEMAPNVYIHVSFIQPHLQTANDLPIRTYGILPILIENRDSRLTPVITSADEFKPGQKITVKVKESTGRPMTYTLALVDEGLLGLTRFGVPNPWAQFYKREASLIKTWDLYDMVAGALAGKLENLLAIGGGDELDGAGRKKANRFPPLVRFIAPSKLAAGAENSHEIQLPQYIGAVRIMVVAADKLGTVTRPDTQISLTGPQSKVFPSFGAAEKSVFVKQEVMVLPTVPRVLAPGEEAEIPVSVFWMGTGARSIPVSIKLDGPITLVSPSSTNAIFKEPGDQIVSFRIKALERIGIARLVVEAQGPREKARQEVEFDLRLPASSQTVVKQPSSTGALLAGKNWQESKSTLAGYPGSNKVWIELTTLPPIDLGKRLEYLIAYPHGCIEQTTSGVFPQLFLGEVMDLSAEQKSRIQTNIQAGIERLKSFMTPSGGFGYWPGDPIPSGWGSNYAGHFILEAKKRGYSVPDDMLNNWRKFQREAANAWSNQQRDDDSTALDQAYRLYGLALDGSAELSTLNRLKESGSLGNSTARWRLAAAYLLMGQGASSRDLVSKADFLVDTYRELGGSFGSDFRDKAMILESMMILNNPAGGLELARDLSERLSKSDWLSTQETAYGLLALSRFAGYMSGGKRVTATLKWNGSNIALSSDKAVLRIELPLSSNASNVDWDLVNTGATPFFPRIVMTGVPQLGGEKTANSGVGMALSWLDSEGRRLQSLDQVSAGDDVTAQVTVINNVSRGKKLEQMALSFQIASGFEIINERMQAGAQDSDTSQKAKDYDYMDIRDDRVYIYFSLNPGQFKTFKIPLSAVYKGKFYQPATKVYAMYNEEIQATQAGYWVNFGSKPSTGDGK